MKSNVKSRVVIGTVTVVAIGVGLYAASSFTPNAQPIGYVGGGALSNSVVMQHDYYNLTGGAKLYMPWFENGKWQGDLIQYDIAADGSATPTHLSISLSTNLPENLGAGNWSARIQFNTAENNDGSGNYNTWWTDTRKVITWDGTQQVPFRWSKLAADQQLAVDATASAADSTNTIVDFVRGERANESGVTASTTLVYRPRWNLLGDIVHSTPVYVGAPKEVYNFGSYETFRDDDALVATRLENSRVYVGANDGMLHAFEADTGNEAFAYVPSMLLGNLNKLKAIPYVHTYFVDGQLTVGDAQMDSAQHTSGWATVLVGTLGAGGKGVFAMDVTDPALASEDAPGKVLWELNATADDDLGYTYSKPTIARLSNGKWYAIFGNGYMSTNGKAKLYVVNLNDPTDITRIEAGTGGSTSEPNGLSSPAVIDIDNDFEADYAYAGDLDGNMWKFDLRDVSNMTAAYSTTPLYYTGGNQAITTQPDVVPHLGGYLVYFGTGRILTGGDLADETVQSLYAIYDTGTAPSSYNLLSQTLSPNIDYDSDTVTRWASNSSIDWTTHTGWKVNLPAGERLVTNPVVRAGRMQMITTNPTVGDAENWMIQLNYKTGGAPTATVIDLNDDHTLTDADNIGGGTAATDRAVARKLADGAASALTFGVVDILEGEGTIDTTFYNNMNYDPICVSDCPDGFVGGSLDVMTDSPWGPEGPGTDEDGVTQNANGLGGKPNGHHHVYDKVHGVVYVDLLGPNANDNSSASRSGMLEPRRNLTSLNAEVNVETAGRRLNSVEEVYATSGDTASRIAGTKEFIVIVANGDLSPGGTLQIGSREWPVQEYQNMVTTKLIALGGAAATDANFKDNDGNSLVFTLDEIKAAGTLRVSFDNKSIIEGNVHPTLAECVSGDKVPYDYSNPTGSNLHITKVPTGASKDPNANKGFRWRNGALTLQLLDASNYTLQPVSNGLTGSNLKYWLPVQTSGNSYSLVGGLYAKKYSAISNEGTSSQTITLSEGANESGLLYEATMFWHFGDLAKLRNGGQQTACYGSSNWQAAKTIELGGLTNGEYQALLNGMTDDSPEIIAYFAAEDAVAACRSDSSCTEGQLTELIKALHEAITPVADYVKYRGYVPGSHVPDTQRLDEDKQAGETTSSTEEPPAVGEYGDITGTGYSSGPNYREGRRSWTDISPE